MGKHGRNNVRRVALAAATTLGVAFGSAGCGENGPEQYPSVGAGSLAGLEGGNADELTDTQWLVAQDVGVLAVKLLTDPKVKTKRIDSSSVTNKVNTKKDGVILVDSKNDYTVSQPQGTISFDRESGTLTTAIVGARTKLDDPKLPVTASAEADFKLPEGSPLYSDGYITLEEAKTALQNNAVPIGLMVEASPKYNMNSGASLLDNPLSVVESIGTDIQLHTSE